MFGKNVVVPFRIMETVECHTLQMARFCGFSLRDSEARLERVPDLIEGPKKAGQRLRRHVKWTVAKYV